MLDLMRAHLPLSLGTVSILWFLDWNEFPYTTSSGVEEVGECESDIKPRESVKGYQQ